ncbi:hypothetical protein LTR86_003485 [Recurvomyces mirabilis]|nr:hypothetical protein LTR86_003485 [Recurvomyces mirabilis]
MLFSLALTVLLPARLPLLLAEATTSHDTPTRSGEVVTQDTRGKAFLNSTRHALQRRWFSVSTPKEGSQIGGRKHGLWPVQKFEPGNPIYPPCGFRRLMPFCFDNENSAKELLSVTATAIAQWWPAFALSSLMMISDEGCYVPHEKRFKFRCICDEQPTDDSTLRIALGDPVEKPGSEYTGGGTEEYTRQHEPSQCDVGCDTRPGSLGICHRLVISRMEEIVGKRERYESQAADMVHEIGHAMGLLHEHQRPDRDHFVRFFCSSLKGYTEAEAMAGSPDHAEDWKPGVTQAEKMKLICSDHDYAEKYLPAARQFLKLDSASYGGDKGIMFNEQFFDYASIMIYCSFTHVHDEERAVLIRNKPTDQTSELPVTRKDGSAHWLDGAFYPGGARRYGDVRISTMDVIRVGQLYPGTKTQQQALAALQPGMMWKPIHMKDMVFSPAWGAQLREILGDWLLMPSFPDVADVQLRDTFARELRWAVWYRQKKNWPDLKTYRQKADKIRQAMKEEAGGR